MKIDVNEVQSIGAGIVLYPVNSFCGPIEDNCLDSGLSVSRRETQKQKIVYCANN